jgi:6-phosphogluconolactonase
MSARPIRILDSPEALARAVTDAVAHGIREAVAARGRCLLCLSGGSTPRAVYQLLATERQDPETAWERVDVYWSDERCVPPDHEQSNYRMAHDTLLAHVPVRPEAVHRIAGELGPEQAASHYHADLAALGGDTVPRFDVALLGLGTDGHTASLFPDTPHLRDDPRLAVATRGPAPPQDRVTLTLRVLNAARQGLFLVSGTAKAPMLARVFAERAAGGEQSLPAAMVQPADGELLWLADRSAAALVGDTGGDR